jgi:hypothetical protein
MGCLQEALFGGLLQSASRIITPPVAGDSINKQESFFFFKFKQFIWFWDLEKKV